MCVGLREILVERASSTSLCTKTSRKAKVLSVSFFFYCELNAGFDAVDMLVELFNVVLIYDNKDVIDILFPKARWIEK